MLLAMGTLLQEIGFGEQYPFYIVVNDREILKAMQRYAGFPEGILNRFPLSWIRKIRLEETG